MKRFITTILLALCSLSVFAQFNEEEPEKVKPMRDVTIVRNVSLIDIDGDIFYDVKVLIKSISADYIIHNEDRVKVEITDKNNKKIWKKTLRNAYLYVFSNGQVQIGKPNFNRIIIYKSLLNVGYIGTVREYEGVY
ncbi:MAG: hypothetical protein IJZ67_02095 [Alistipes sp.]|nr:hypothetical protein [Alistipes sp.]